MIPAEKNEAVNRGLREAFGVTEIEEISTIPTGYSLSLVCRIVVRGTPYLLKIIRRADDPTRHYSSMKATAAAGLAPRVWYTSVEDKVSITDFVRTKPLSREEALVRLPPFLRRLHTLASFGRAPFNTTCTFLLNQGPMLEGWMEKFKAAKVLPEAECEEFFARYAEIAAVYPLADEMVSSHNDLFKPDNILFDGKQVWLVDWEAAFLNDRYAELAVVANQLVTNEEEEVAYLQAYFGATPDEYQLARLHLMQQLAHLFYTTLLAIPTAAAATIDWSQRLPEFEEYQRRMWVGEVSLDGPEGKSIFARVQWNRLLHNVQQPRYKDALNVVAARG